MLLAVNVAIYDNCDPRVFKPSEITEVTNKNIFARGIFFKTVVWISYFVSYIGVVLKIKQFERKPWDVFINVKM